MIYKIVVKVLVERMSGILDSCIGEAQGAFIPGRHISDNVLIAYEVLHSLKMRKKSQKSNFALKLDMSKAYNCVEWNFLARMMSNLGFHIDWITLFMRCICSVSYTVGINDEINDSFVPSRGLRQALSSYLFLLYVEGFFTLFRYAKSKGEMIDAPIGRQRLVINNLFFVDDCILFGDATRLGACTIKSIISEYESVFGQKVNFDKSLIYFGIAVTESDRKLIIDLLKVRTASNLEKYLVLPIMVGRNKNRAFANYVDKFRKKMES